MLGDQRYTGGPGSARSSRIRSVCFHGRVAYLGQNFRCSEERSLTFEIEKGVVSEALLEVNKVGY